MLSIVAFSRAKKASDYETRYPSTKSFFLLQKLLTHSRFFAEPLELSIKQVYYANTAESRYNAPACNKNDWSLDMCYNEEQLYTI